MSLERKLKTALDETRLLILGAQVLFGFQFNGAFQELFSQLSQLSRILQCTALFLLMCTIGLLIAPSMRHRLVDAGQNTNEAMRATTFFAGLALVPIACGLSLDVFVITDRIYGPTVGAWCAAAFLLTALMCWYGLEFSVRRSDLMHKREPEKPTPLSTKVDQLLTEARVIIPGAQALLGFQFAVTLTRAFDQLPEAAKLVHVVALFCVALAVILLMAPAALHRLSFAGEDASEFVKMGSAFVVTAPFPLALGIGLDTYVATYRAFESDSPALLVAGLTLLVLFSLWYAYPLLRRRSLRIPGIDKT